MTRKEFEALVYELYGVRADYPFEEDFTTGVFRHENGKWFVDTEIPIFTQDREYVEKCFRMEKTDD